jgi:hypothetical protein
MKDKTLSVFVIKTNGIQSKFHDLSPVMAYQVATDYLYHEEQLVKGVKVIIRDEEKIWFSASNPV